MIEFSRAEESTKLHREEMITELVRTWDRHPHLRLGQLICCIYNLHSTEDIDKLFYKTDGASQAQIEKF
jgi:hypothetical protein